MLDSIKSIIGDVAPGAIQDQCLALSREQLTALDSQLKVLARELSEASSKIAILEGENTDLKLRIQRLQPVDGLSKETTDILNFLFSFGRNTSIEQVAQRFGLPMSVAEFRFEELMKRRFVCQTRVGFGISSAAFEITPEGRSHVMQNRTNPIAAANGGSFQLTQARRGA